MCGLFLAHVLYLFPVKVYIYMYIYKLRHLLEILNMNRNMKTMHCKRFESFLLLSEKQKKHILFFVSFISV